MPTYGVLGVGAIARAIVTGLCHEVADPPPVVLSPRGAATSAELARLFSTVEVATDNQAVLDSSDVVLICLRTADAHLLGELDWRVGPRRGERHGRLGHAAVARARGARHQRLSLG